MTTQCFCSFQNLIRTRKTIAPTTISSPSIWKPDFIFFFNNSSNKSSQNLTIFTKFNRLSCKSSSIYSFCTKNYEFLDGSSEVEMRLQLEEAYTQSTTDIVVDADESSLAVRVKKVGSLVTLVETSLYDKIKPAETIWYIDDDELVVSMQKLDTDLKWPDIAETWESLTAGAAQILKGTSIYLVGDSTVINQRVAKELAVGLGYTPLSTKELLESFAKNTVESWTSAEGPNPVADAEGAILESLSSHVRAVVGTLGGNHGAAGRADKWQHLYAGFTVWLSESDAKDESSAKEEARRHYKDGTLPYSNSDVVVKLQGWDPDYAKSVAQASLSALKKLILSDKKLPGKKSLYIRLGCRGDWPNIMPPGESVNGAERTPNTL